MKVLLINTQRPGPIEANWGDRMQITVTNRITGPEEGGILYWHGLLQVGIPGFDGASPVQQCPIAPGSTFTYTFKASLYGTCWYDARYSAHNAEGSTGSRISLRVCQVSQILRISSDVLCVETAPCFSGHRENAVYNGPHCRSASAVRADQNKLQCS